MKYPSLFPAALLSLLLASSLHAAADPAVPKFTVGEAEVIPVVGKNT